MQAKRPFKRAFCTLYRGMHAVETRATTINFWLVRLPCTSPSHGSRGAATLVFAGSPAACNGGAASVIGGVTNNAYVRVLHGSPDAGSLDIALDSASNIIRSGAVYGNLTTYQQVKTGSHTLYVFANGQDTGTGIISPITRSVNGSSDTTIVLSGEMRPSYQAAANFGATTFTEQPFSVPNAGAAIVFHNAAPFAAAALPYEASRVRRVLRWLNHRCACRHGARIALSTYARSARRARTSRRIHQVSGQHGPDRSRSAETPSGKNEGAFLPCHRPFSAKRKVSTEPGQLQGELHITHNIPASISEFPAQGSPV